MIRIRNILDGLSEIADNVVCFTPNADENSKYYNESNEIHSEIKIIRYGEIKRRHNICDSENGKSIKQGFLSLIKNVYKKFDLFGRSILYVKYKRNIAQEIKDYDVLITFSDPKTSHIIGGYCKKNNLDMKYIQQWGDPLADDITSTSLLPRFVKKYIEWKLMSCADKICYVSPVTLQSQRKVFPKIAEKMFFVPTPCEEHTYDKSPGSELKIGYVGSYSPVARNIMPYYNAAKKMSKIKFEFIGDLERELNLEETPNIRILGRQPHNKLDDYMKHYDVMVCLMNKRGTQIPGKIFNYAGTNKEILVIQDGEYGEKIKKYFERYNRFTFVNNTEADICSALEKYINFGIEERFPLPEFMASRVAQQLVSDER